MNSVELIRPIVALVALTGLVWALMVVARNAAVLRGTASIGYFRGYTGTAPPERIERPARAFMNLLEVPVLFYLVCVLMLVTQRFDSTQVALAWAFRRDPRRPRGDPHRLERRARALRRVPGGVPHAGGDLGALRGAEPVAGSPGMSPEFSLGLRLAHFFNFLFLSLLVRSGIEILGAHPKLYWRDDVLHYYPSDAGI